MSTEDTVQDKSTRRRKRRGENEKAEVEKTTEEDDGGTERKGRATPSARKQRGKQPEESGNFFSRMFGGFTGYMRGVKDELDKVVWPDREELLRLARIVTVVVVISAATLGAISAIYNQIFVVGLGDTGQEGHPEVFVVLFGLVVAAYFYATRKPNSDTTL
jgi:preprotein translocase SecE subunit